MPRDLEYSSKLSNFAGMEKGKPIITVVVNTFQHERFIAQCLDGVLMQRGDFQLHLLVIDDASSDSTPDIIRDYAARYPELIEPVLLTKNIFMTGRKTQDVIIPRLRGKYVAICEGDDFWTAPQKLQQQVSFLETHPDYSACFHLYDILNETPSPAPAPPRMRRSGNVSVQRLVLEHLAHTNSILMRREIFFQGEEYWEIYKKMYPVTDILVFAWLARLGKVYGFAQRWSMYRIHSKGIYTQARLETNSTSAGHSAESKLISLMYDSAHPMKKWLRLYEQLEQWTLLRRAGKPVKAVLQLFRAFIYNPTRFLRLYYSRYFL